MTAGRCWCAPGPGLPHDADALSGVRRVPGAKSKQPPARTLLEYLRHREADVLRFLTDTAIPPTSLGRTRPAALENPAEDQRSVTDR